MTHPHAEFLRAIADGDDINQWVCNAGSNYEFHERLTVAHVGSIVKNPKPWKVWRKPKTLTYSVTIPEPLKEEPEVGMVVYWYSQDGYEQETEWVETVSQSRLLKNRQLFRTAEDARLAFIRRNGLEEE